MDKVLEQLLGSKERIRVLRLFFQNPEEFFALRDISTKTKLNQRSVRKELTVLKQIQFLKTKYVQIGKNRRRELWGASPEFLFWDELKALVLKSSRNSFSHITSELKKLGSVKLAVLGGAFINQNHARVDMLIVMVRPQKRKLTNFISNIEADSGREINCLVVTPAEFKYRYDLYDRVVRDMLSSENVRVIDRLAF